MVRRFTALRAGIAAVVLVVTVMTVTPRSVQAQAPGEICDYNYAYLIATFGDLDRFWDYWSNYNCTYDQTAYNSLQFAMWTWAWEIWWTTGNYPTEDQQREFILNFLALRAGG